MIFAIKIILDDSFIMDYWIVSLNFYGIILTASLILTESEFQNSNMLKETAWKSVSVPLLKKVQL